MTKYMMTEAACYSSITAEPIPYDFCVSIELPIWVVAMKSNDPVDLLKEKASRAASRYARIRRYAFVGIGTLILAASVFLVQNLPEQKFVNAHISDNIGSIAIRGDYTDFWEVTQNEPPQRDLFQNWPQDIAANAATSRCGDKFAILVHEPHSDRNQEWRLFYLLWYLQSDHPELFSNLAVFQEGSAGYPLSNRRLLRDENILFDETRPHSFAMQPQVQFNLSNSWLSFESTMFSPANTIGAHTSPEQVVSNVDGLSVGQTFEGWSDRLETNIAFHAFTNSNGSINTQRAVEYLIEVSDVEDKRASIEALRSLEPQHANLAEYLLSNGYLRAAFAYELFAEGYTQTSHQTVDVFGVEDIGLYGTSCKLQEGCSGDDTDQSRGLWHAVQPYRRAVMANNILRRLDGFSSTTVPVISASIHSHLVDIRGYLCDAGYDTVGLTPTENVAGDLQAIDVLQHDLPNIFDGLGTSPLSDFGTTPLGFPTIEGSILDVLRRAGWMRSKPPIN